MRKTISIVMIYCGLMFAALTILSLWPVGANRVLVVVPEASSASPQVMGLPAHQHIFSMLAGTDASIIEQVSEHSFVIAVPASVSSAFVQHLYGHGALLVINVAGDFACNGAQKNASFRSILS